jgi:hypothetical protein
MDMDDVVFFSIGQQINAKADRVEKNTEKAHPPDPKQSPATKIPEYLNSVDSLFPWSSEFPPSSHHFDLESLFDQFLSKELRLPLCSPNNWMEL